SPEFFYVSQGTLTDLSRILGFGPAKVERTMTPRGVVFDVHVQLEGRRFARMLHSVRARLAFATAGELKEAHEELVDRYRELEDSRQNLEGAKRALQLIHEIATATHRNLDLRGTLATIADNVVSRLGYDSVRVGVGVREDEVQLAHEEVRGDQALLVAGAHSVPLRVGEKVLGELSVGRASAPVTAPDLRLLTQLAESIGLAVKNAIDYEVIRNYRSSLETKVEQRTVDLEEANDRLARSLESRTQFFANVNHELRTPLAVILLTAKRLAEAAGPPREDTERLALITRNADRLQGMVDGLLLLASGAEKSANIQLERIRVHELTAGVARSLRPLADAKGLEFASSVEPGLAVDADPRLLETALLNLVGNAIKYTDSGRVALEAASDGPGVQITVTDTGPGIPEAYQASIFDRFVQVPMAASRPGVGLGLALVKEIAAQHGGTVSVSSVLGLGTTMRLCLPRRAVAAPLPAQAAPAAERPVRPPVLPATAGGTQPRVLLCEDNEDLAAGLCDLLEGNSLTVDRASTAEQALEIAASRPPDLLLTDIGLGAGMDGLELCRRFKELPSHRNAPMLVLTAGRPGSKLGAFEAGAIDYLTKPFNSDELLARVQAHLALRAMAARLAAAESLAAQSAVLAGVAHELRNPLNGIINAIGPLRRRLPPEALPPGSSAARLLEVLEECGNRAAHLSRDLLSFVRGAPLVVEVQPLQDLVRRALLVIGPKLEGARFSTRLEAQGAVRGSGIELSQVIINLVENALESAGGAGEVEMVTEDKLDQVLLEVRDTGPGVPADLRERVFEPFFTTKSPGRGTGLGLSISRDIVRRHGGTLAMHGGAGAFCVKLTLPRSPEGAA
ncbi:MAG: ATP-binding protein, partial [Myxococcaceae bacterium]